MQLAPVTSIAVSRRGLIRNRRNCPGLRVRASDDEDTLPIFSGRLKSGFTPAEEENLRHPKLLGGKTIGEELGELGTRHREVSLG